MTPEERLAAIEERNVRVQSDKAWETSRTRRAVIAAITYVTAVVLVWVAGGANPFFSALVPMFGYLLSTLSLPWAKHRWLARKKTL